jgi:hypothetical protein
VSSQNIGVTTYTGKLGSLEAWKPGTAGSTYGCQERGMLHSHWPSAMLQQPEVGDEINSPRRRGKSDWSSNRA